MKFLLAILLSVSSLWAWAEEQNIVLATRLDQKSSASFIKRMRNFLINNGFGDPYNRSLTEPISIDLNKALQELPPDTQSWIKEFQSLLSLKLFESKYRFIVEGFSYSIEDFNSELRPVVSGVNRVEYVTHNHVKGISFSARRVSFQVELKRTQSGDPINFSIDLLGPEFIIHPELVLELPMLWQTSLTPELISLSLNSIDLTKMFRKILDRPELVELRVSDIHLPDVSVRVGHKEIKFDHKKIKKFLSDEKDGMKKGILDIIKAREETLVNILEGSPQEISVSKMFSIRGKINAIFDVKSIFENQISGTLEAGLNGYFCSKGGDLSQFCRSQRVTAKKRRIVSSDLFKRSMFHVQDQLAEEKSHIVVSVSEHYLNELIMAADQGGVLELTSDKFTLGPEKAFVLADKYSENFTLYIDILHKLSGSQRVLVGRSELRFPVRLGIGLKILDINGMPTLRIKVNTIETNEDLLIRGKAEYGLPTNVTNIRFRKKVLKSIMEEIHSFKDMILLDLEIPELKDTYLEELNFYSDGFGRGTATLTLDSEK